MKSIANENGYYLILPDGGPAIEWRGVVGQMKYEIWILIIFFVLLVPTVLLIFQRRMSPAVGKGTGTANEDGNRIFWPDFIKYNGSYYLYEEKECRKMDVAEELGEIREKSSEDRREAYDFEASRLETGTELYRIRGVMDDSQLAAKREETYKVYEMVSDEEFYKNLSEGE
ncbi:hypothetical protein [Qiania dongpingensis]|uniref:Uncharacterized protein n=1 Tax=Qiania dongpingensis TaxID=2763669 RepID=A0A7G9G585_9FIRM|nr:hypothetical protein [Qiania dongpingensis]QNM05967.1 hypothetical protein H9Q78_02010 [Qiania dongpingensis]